MTEKDIISAGCSSSFLLADCPSTGYTQLLWVSGGLTSYCQTGTSWCVSFYVTSRDPVTATYDHMTC